MRRPGAAVTAVLLLCAAAVVVALEPWQGPVVLTLSASHGVHLVDLAGVPLVVLAIAVWRRHQREAGRAARSGGRAAAVSAVALGVPLLLAGVVATAGGGPLEPAGGGTLGGSIELASATSAVPVGRWSDVAVTYDGARVRLYVDGEEVASRARRGTIQRSQDPLWIGGNRPYGEHFHGLVDEVRVYDRALRPDEIRRDMARPVSPARGLVAAYGFDERSGATATDASGAGNTGAVRGAGWTRGRFGNALSFDGVHSVVDIPPSPSLNLDSAMTLSAWIRPSAPQRGWRTIVQRQTDAYLLTAGSTPQVRLGGLDDLHAALTVAALGWFCLLLAGGRFPTTGRRRRWWMPAALFVAGSVADAALAPEPAMIGPALVAAWLAATASRRTEKWVFALAAAALVGLTIAAPAVPAGTALVPTTDEGAIARSVALGLLFVLAGAQQMLQRRASVRRPGIR
jgi:concanavalin A-like lectin/glucanase superfamily protein